MKKILAVALLGLVLTGCGGGQNANSPTQEDLDLIAEAEAEKKEAEEKKESPKPKATPVVTEEPKVTAEQAQYAQDMGEHIEFFGEVLGDFSNTMFKAGNDPSLMVTEGWTMEVAVQLTTMDELIGMIQGIHPPAGLEEAHDMILLSMDEFQFVVDNLPTAIDNMDTELMYECTDAINRGGQYMNDASILLAEGLE